MKSCQVELFMKMRRGEIVDAVLLAGLLHRVAITNYERGGNPGSTVITVRERFHDTLVTRVSFHCH